MRATQWMLLWICLIALCCCQRVKARPSLFHQSSLSASPPKTKTRRRTVSHRTKKVDAEALPRGGEIATTKPNALLDVLLDPRVALKTLSVALGCFGVELLLFPVMFRDTFLKNALRDGLQVGSTPAMDFLQHFLGMRELFLSTLFWKSAQDGTDEMCRLLVTMAFWTISLPQLYYISQHDVLRNAQVKQFMTKLYAFFCWLNGLAMIKSWYQKWRGASKV